MLRSQQAATLGCRLGSFRAISIVSSSGVFKKLNRGSSRAAAKAATTFLAESPSGRSRTSGPGRLTLRLPGVGGGLANPAAILTFLCELRQLL